jgi:hypothetical protein
MSDDQIDFEEGLLNFEGWRASVDRYVDKFTGKVGLCAEDFRDWGFADAFGDGMEPEDAARALLAEDGPNGWGLLDLHDAGWREKVLV